MQIINLLDHERHDIEAPLLQMVSSEDHLEAFKGQKLLELVRYLQAQGPAPRACGHLMLGLLCLMPSGSASQVSVDVWVDWRDYGPLRDGLPEAYYRLQIRRGKAPCTRDARAATPAEAEQIIWEAFGWR
jgi:hypothetical protein